MKFTINKDLFEEALTLSSRFSSNKPSGNQAILGCLLEVKKETLTITTTNLNDFYTADIEVNQAGEGTAVVDLKKLLEFIHYLPQGATTLELKEKTVLVTQGKTKGLIKTFSAEEFPRPPKTEGEIITITKEAIKNIQRVGFSASKDEARPILTGMLMTIKNKELVFVTTDGFRLSYTTTKEVKGLQTTIAPTWVFEEAAKLSSGKDILIQRAQEENAISIKTEKATLYSRLLSGDFPPYEKVIPETHTTQVFVKKEDLIKGVRLAAVFAKEQADVVILDISKDELYVTPRGQKREESAVFIETERIIGEPLKIAFNYRYILEFLSNTEKEEVELGFTQSTAPGAFKEKGNTEYVHVIMPLRTEETTSD